MGRKVAFLHPDLGVGGAERLIVDAALELCRKGWEVEVWTASHDPSRCFPETLDGPFSVRVAGSWFPRTLRGRFAALCAWIRCLLCALSLALAHWRGEPRVDAVIADQVSIVVPVLRFCTRVPVVFYCHFPDLLLASRGPGTSAARAAYRKLLDDLEERSTGFADRILVNSNFTKRVFLETFSRLAARGVDPDVLTPAVDVPSPEKMGVDAQDASAAISLAAKRLARRTVEDAQRKRASDAAAATKAAGEAHPTDMDVVPDAREPGSGQGSSATDAPGDAGAAGGDADRGCGREPVDEMDLEEDACAGSAAGGDDQSAGAAPASSSPPAPTSVDPRSLALPPRVAEVVAVSRRTNAPVLLSINRFERKKDLALAIKALKLLPEAMVERAAAEEAAGGARAGALRAQGGPAAARRRGEATALIVAGGYDARLPENAEVLRELRALARRLGVRDRVAFAPGFSERCKGPLLAVCDVVVYTPANEHFGIVPIEAGAAARAVVAVASGGPTETVLPGETGELAEPTPEAFARALAKLVVDPSVARAAGAVARSRVRERFGRAAFGDALDAVLVDACAADERARNERTQLARAKERAAERERRAREEGRAAGDGQAAAKPAQPALSQNARPAKPAAPAGARGRAPAPAPAGAAAGARTRATASGHLGAGATRRPGTATSASTGSWASSPGAGARPSLSSTSSSRPRR